MTLLDNSVKKKITDWNIIRLLVTQTLLASRSLYDLNE